MAIAAWLALAVALLPSMWYAVARDNDPRLQIGNRWLIGHQDRGEIVMVSRRGPRWTFHYAAVTYLAALYFVCWLLVWLAGFVRGYLK